MDISGKEQKPLSPDPGLVEPKAVARKVKKAKPQAEAAGSVEAAEDRHTPDRSPASADVHTEATPVPCMPDDQDVGLRDNIAAHGLRDPIKPYQGMVIDETNRLRECQELDIEPKSGEVPPEVIERCGGTISYVLGKPIGTAANVDATPAQAGESAGVLYHVPVSEIRIGQRHRRDHGDVKALAKSIAEHGQLQPIGVTEQLDLVFGTRRLMAIRDVLKHETILARVLKVADLVGCESDENLLRKDFTVTERVAIAKTLEAALGERRGGNRSNGQKIDACRGSRSDEVVAQRAGFGNRQTYRDAKRVVEQGVDKLQEAMDLGQVSISLAARIAKEKLEDQIGLLNGVLKKCKRMEEGPASATAGGASAANRVPPLQAVSDECERLDKRVDAALKALNSATPDVEPQTLADIRARLQATVERLQRLNSIIFI